MIKVGMVKAAARGSKAEQKALRDLQREIDEADSAD